MNIIFPSEPYNHKNPDFDYQQESEVAKNNNFKVAYFDLDELKAGNFKSNIRASNFDVNEPTIYRGWMLLPDEYSMLYNQVQSITQCSLISSPTEYLNSHYLPNWYPHLQEHTMKTIITDEANAHSDFLKSSWNNGFLKDYVKSLTTSKGSIFNSPEELSLIISQLKQNRGNIEGGLCIREVVELVPNSEFRFFSLNGTLFSSSESPHNLIELAQSINSLHLHASSFFSIDLALLSNNSPILVEVGDGQVSDFKHWNIIDFYNIFSPQKPYSKAKLY